MRCLMTNTKHEDAIMKKEDKMEMLTSKLLKEKRLDDLQKATEDKEYCEQLMKEYDIA